MVVVGDWGGFGWKGGRGLVVEGVGGEEIREEGYLRGGGIE